MTVIGHDESLKDRAVMAAMRAALAVSPAPELKPESGAAYDRAQRQGRACDVHVWKGMTHVFPANVSMLGAATEALDEVASFLRQELGRRAATENERL